MAEREAAIESKEGRGDEGPWCSSSKTVHFGVCSPCCIGERGTWAFKFLERVPEMGQELLWIPPGERLLGQEGAYHVLGCSALPKLCLPQVFFLHLSPKWIGLRSELSMAKVPAPQLSAPQV